MKKTIKYLDNDGNYQYATVKDAGDLDKLKTKAKEDLVSAINELATNGIAASDIDEINNKVDQIQQQANQNADALNMSDQERQEMQQQIAQMQAEVQAKVAELQKLAEEQNKKLQEASAELKKKADAIDVQKMQQDNAEALKNSAKALEDSLAATNEDLQKTADHLNEMEIQAGVVETSVKELQNGFESKVSSADFNEARTKLQEQETMVRQLNNELSTKASNNELDMVTQRVQKAESNIQQNAQGIKASVTKETMYKEMDDFAKYRENRLKYSRDFSNDWSLNGNDVIDDDHLFDTQHDVKSVSIRNGAYLTQTTDLDTDDMSKTFTLAMWVEKGKRPRAWYGSAELTNMKVKEDKGDYQRVYWTFVPTIVKQDIRITGDTSTQGNLIISEPKLEQSDRPSAWSTNTGDQYATTEKLAHDLKLTADKLESTITKQSEFSDRQQQDESRITQTEHGVEVANQTIVAKTDGLRQEFDGKISATSKSLTSEYQSFTNQAIGQMADGGSNLILNSSFGNLKNSYDKWTNVSPKVRIVEDDNGLKWAKMEQSGLTANSPIGLTSNLFRVKKGIVTVALDIRTDNAASIDNDNIVILESYNADQKRVFTQGVGFSAFKITKETLSDHGPHRVTYKYNQTRDDTQYMAVHIVLPKNGVLYVTNVLARTVANGEDSGEYAPNAADLHEQVVQQRTRIEQNDHAIALKADQTKVTQDIDAAKSSLSGAISRVEQRAANLEVKANGITSSVSSLSKTIDGISVGGRNLVRNTDTDIVIDDTGNTGTRGWRFVTINLTQQPKVGDQITVSAEGTLTGRGNLGTYDVILYNSTTSNARSNSERLSSGKRSSATLQVNNLDGNGNTVLLIYAGNFSDTEGKKNTVHHLKVEFGNVATDWTPAPEDTDADISALESRASKLEQTDSEIKASVTSVTNDLKNGRGTIKEGLMSMTDDHFSTKFSSIDNKIDGISVGGTNLLLNTKDFTGDWYQQGSASLQDLDGRKVIHAWADWSSYRTRQVIQLEQNTDYTISADIRSLDGNSSDNTVTIHGFLDGKDTQLGDLHTNGKLSSKQQRFSAVWHNTSAGQLTTFRLEGHGGWSSVNGSIYISHIKLEKGNKPTDWSPAIEDTSAEIKSAKDAAIQVASDQINLHVNELSTQFDDKLNKRVNEVKTASEKFTSDGIEQVVTKVTDVKNDVDRLGDTVGNLEVGGRNLLIGTSNDEKSGEAYAFAGYQISGGLQPNKTYTLSGWARVDQNSLNHRQNVFIDAYSEDWSWSVSLGINASLDWQYNKITFTTPAGKQLHPYVTVYLSHPDGGTNDNNNDAASGMAFIKKLKLEKGNIATDWTQAPEDIEQTIKDATEYKTVTGTIDFNNLKTQQKIFYKDTQATNTPAGGSYWYYLDVEPGDSNSRIIQTAVSDRDNITWVRTFVDSWSPWVKQADQRNIDDLNNQINSFKTETTASVKNLGDRVTTEVNSVTTKINNGYSNDTELIKKSDFEDGDKGGWVAQTIVAATNPAPPAELGQSGMKVLQVNNRDNVEQGTWYSVKPGEKFDVDFWACPSPAFHSTFGLQFVDKNHQNYNWKGVQTDQSGQWKHYKGVIQAPPNATFAMPWFQMEKPADNTTNTAWLAKPHIRRQNPAVVDAINSLNTKWDVANGQIQGKVTATDVNNILNGKGYATQSWAQTMFTMKSDAITLQAVRDNITNGIQNQVNDAKSQINSANDRIDETNEKIDKAKIGERNLAVGTNRGKTGWTIDPGDGQSTMDDSWVNDAMGVVFNNSKKSTSWWVAQYPFDMSRLKPNTFYTISFDIQTDVKINGNGTVDFARGNSTGTPFIGSNGVKIITEPGGTTHVVHMAKTKGNIENNGQAFYFNSKDIGQANWVKIFNLMIVEGTQSIAWAAAPEDDDVKQKGVNLLKSSAYWSPGDWNIRLTDGSWVDDNWIDGLGHKTYGRKNGAWNGLGQTVYVTPGIYTWSAQIYVDNFADNDFVQAYMGDSQYNGTAQTISIRIPQLRKSDSDKWVNYSATFFVKNAGNLCVRPELNNAHGEVHVGSQKLEHGMVATPWTPAPTDDNTQTITLDSANIDNMKAQGHYFVKNLTGNPIPGWVYVDVTGNGNDRIKQDVYQDNGSHHKYRRWVGSWTEWVDDVNKDNILSQINISPEKIRLLSNKIEIDGNTYIHGTLNVPEVILKGKSGQIDLSGGQGIDIKSSTGDNHVKLTSNDVRIGGNVFFNQIDNKASSYYYNGVKLGAIGRNSLTGDDQIKGLDMYFAPGQNNSGSNFEGGTYLALGYDDPNGDTIIPQIRLNFRDYATSHTTFKKGISLEDDVYFHQNNVHISTHSTWWIDSNPNGQDGIYFANYKWNDSWQPDFYQPTLMAGHGGDKHGDSGLSFLWNSLKLFGTLDLTGTRIRVNNAIVTPVFGWVSWTKWQNAKHLALVDYNGFGGYAMSADGSPVLFGRDNTFSLLPNAGGTETGRNTGMSRYGDKDWKSPVS